MSDLVEKVARAIANEMNRSGPIASKAVAQAAIEATGVVELRSALVEIERRMRVLISENEEVLTRTVQKHVVASHERARDALSPPTISSVTGVVELREALRGGIVGITGTTLTFEADSREDVEVVFNFLCGETQLAKGSS